MKDKETVMGKASKLHHIILLAAVFALTAFSAMAQSRRALVVGLGEQQDSSWEKIHGDNDVEYVTSMLRRCRFKDIRTLKNREATKAGIVSALRKLARRCKEGDVVYVHFSGHGQQMTDLDGDEADGWDESWIPYDAYASYGPRDHGERHLSDDELNRLLTNIAMRIGKAGKMLVVADACHSGDSTSGDRNDVTVRGAYDEFVIPLATKPHPIGKRPLRWLMLSACMDFERNEEMTSPKAGKLTYTLHVLSKEGRLDMKSIREFMSDHQTRLPQTPSLDNSAVSYTIADVLLK